MLELLPCFGSFGAVKLVDELRGHEVRLAITLRGIRLGGASAVLAADAPHVTGSMRVGAQNGCKRRW